jgi:DNA-binding response OmpR family regulator
MTGYPGMEDCIDMLGIGIQEILLKPISPDEVLRVAREALSEE